MSTANFFRASTEEFKKIPGAPIAYWVHPKFCDCFDNPGIDSVADVITGMTIGDNNKYLRTWPEIAYSRMAIDRMSMKDVDMQAEYWIPYSKGGARRNWYGNHEYVVNWAKRENFNRAKTTLSYRYLQEAITWPFITSGLFSARFLPQGSLWDVAGSPCFFKTHAELEYVLAVMCSGVANYILKIINPTINVQAVDVVRIPLISLEGERTGICLRVEHLIGIAKADWDAYETSWDFAVNPLVALCGSLRPLRSLRQRPQASPNPVNPVNPVEKTNSDSSEATLTLRQDQEARNVSGASEKSEFQIEKLYATLREKWARDCEEMRRLETENNRIFIEAYGLQDELTPDVPWNEITLTCNPYYRYGVKDSNSDSSEATLTLRHDQETRNVSGASEKSEFQKFPYDTALEERLKSDTVKELVSYAVGCMMGRYSLEKPGLILADQGSSLKDYYDKINSDSSEATLTLRQNQETRNVSGASDKSELIFSPDDDGIIPILDNDWFEDDIVTRFKAFIKAAFGEEHFFENMAWIEEALGKDIRSYFTKDFYKDHLQRYQNRPIYWLFQSPKGAFRALVYMHRYKPDMVGGVLGYLRSLQTKVDNQLDVAMQVGADESKSASERVRANKDAVKYAKAKKELDEYEKNVLYPLSTERIEIDLDDGVKVNYKKFGVALRKVAALEGKGE